MCRWLAYAGGPIYLRELILRPRHSLIDQSLSARASATTTNGDGFGVGWYDATERPGLYKHVQPAWSDPNLFDLCQHVRSPLFLAHVRAATHTATQYSNCHPFRHGRWLFVHNGQIHGWNEVRRELVLEIPADLFRYVEGTTDSEVMFHLALGFGLEQDVQGALERTAGFIEDVCRAHGVNEGVEMAVALSDGRAVHAVRYATEGAAPTMYHSKRVAALRQLVPSEHADHLGVFSEDARAIVSEPLTELSEVWEEVEPSRYLVLEAGEIRSARFAPAVATPS
ncbi:MAG: class II glutamine amidotransferase [Planctomycetota bacterium]|nr:class II glutamine amidotransferase [Planctomycetota bacterium]